MLRSPVLLLALTAGSAVGAACGSSDSHRVSRESGGAGGQAGGLAVGGLSSSGAAGSQEPNGGNAAAAGESSAGDSLGGELSLVGGSGNAAGAVAAAGAAGLAGAGGGSSTGCLALHFGNDTDTVQIPDLTIPDFGSAATIELWILPDEGEPDALVAGGCLFNKWVSFQEDKFLYVNPGGDLSVYFAQQAANFRSSAAVKPLEWQHIALAYDATSARIYVNGVKVGEQVGAGLPVNSNGNIQVGRVSRDIQYPALHAFYSELRLSNVARYDASFTPAAHLEVDASTIGLWKLDEGSGTTVADASTLDNPGTLEGAEWRLAACR